MIPVPRDAIFFLEVYLAARLSRAQEMREVAHRLEETGYIHVCSSWINDAESPPYDGSTHECFRHDSERDFSDLFSSDCVVSFMESAPAGRRRGGRHVEFGMGYALGKHMVIVGEPENCFHCLPEVVKVGGVEYLLFELQRIAFLREIAWRAGEALGGQNV